MDFQPTDEQEELRAGVRSLLRQACPPSLVRQVFEAKDGEHDPRAGALWKQMIQLDWPALTIPARFGGLGLGAGELCVVMEELGRAAAPSPYQATVTQFAPVVREVGSPDAAGPLLRAVAEGRVTGTLALAEPGRSRWEPGAVETVARRVNGRWMLQGRKSWVLDGAHTDQVAVVARAEGTSGTDGLGLFVVAAERLAAAALPVIDPTQPMAELTLDGVEVGDDAVLGEPGDPTVAVGVSRAVEEATMCVAAGTVGACRTIFETTLQYAKDREQYGRPIGSFQALKHRLVEMYMSLERAAALTTFAALTIAEDDSRRSQAVSMAKAAAGDCQRLVVQDGLQLHGGIGYTWEHDLHMFLKRAKVGDFVFGTARSHRLAVAGSLGVRP